ncbi:hypothetical protein PR048_005650, partial [Dryococelus australis]
MSAWAVTLLEDTHNVRSSTLNSSYQEQSSIIHQLKFLKLRKLRRLRSVRQSVNTSRDISENKVRLYLLDALKPHYQYLTKIDSGRKVGLHEAGWTHRDIITPVGHSDVTVARLEPMASVSHIDTAQALFRADSPGPEFSRTSPCTAVLYSSGTTTTPPPPPPPRFVHNHMHTCLSSYHTLRRHLSSPLTSLAAPIFKRLPHFSQMATIITAKSPTVIVSSTVTQKRLHLPGCAEEGDCNNSPPQSTSPEGCWGMVIPVEVVINHPSRQVTERQAGSGDSPPSRHRGSAALALCPTQRSKCQASRPNLWRKVSLSDAHLTANDMNNLYTFLVTSGMKDFCGRDASTRCVGTCRCMSKREVFSKTSVLRILHQQKLHTYHVALNQALYEGDFHDLYNQQARKFTKYALLGDRGSALGPTREAPVTAEQECVVWNRWETTSYFIQGTLTSFTYAHFIRETLSVLLEDIPLDILRDIPGIDEPANVTSQFPSWGPNLEIVRVQLVYETSRTVRNVYETVVEVPTPETRIHFQCAMGLSGKRIRVTFCHVGEPAARREQILAELSQSE